MKRVRRRVSRLVNIALGGVKPWVVVKKGWEKLRGRKSGRALFAENNFANIANRWVFTSFECQR